MHREFVAQGDNSFWATDCRAAGSAGNIPRRMAGMRRYLNAALSRKKPEGVGCNGTKRCLFEGVPDWSRAGVKFIGQTPEIRSPAPSRRRSTYGSVEGS
jgi:hypothetical protein